jgi:hypothetical protein
VNDSDRPYSAQCGTTAVSPGDALIAHITYAADTAAAQTIAGQASRAALREAADLLYVDGVGHGWAWVRNAIVSEARA